MLTIFCVWVTISDNNNTNSNSSSFNWHRQREKTATIVVHSALIFRLTFKKIGLKLNIWLRISVNIVCFVQFWLLFFVSFAFKMPGSSFARVSATNYRNKLFEKMMSLTEYLDVVLSVEGLTIQAHCSILAAGSPYFHKMLKHCPAENKKPMCK